MKEEKKQEQKDWEEPERQEQGEEEKKDVDDEDTEPDESLRVDSLQENIYGSTPGSFNGKLTQTPCDLILSDLDQINEMEASDLRDLTCEELAHIASHHAEKLYEESRKSPRAEAYKIFYPENVLLEIAAVDLSALNDIYERFFVGNICVQKWLWERAKELHKTAMESVEGAKNIFENKLFILIPRIDLFTIIKTYKNDENFAKIYADLFQRNYVQDISDTKTCYEAALDNRKQAEELLALSSLNLILSPLHIAHLIKEHSLQLKLSQNSFETLAQMEVEFVITCFSDENLIADLSAFKIFKMIQAQGESESYQNALKEGKIARNAYLSAIIYRLKSCAQFQYPSFSAEVESFENKIRDPEQGKSLRKLLEIEAEILFTDCKHHLYYAKTLFFRQYLFFNLKQAVTLLKCHYENEAFFAIFSIWLEENRSILPNDDVLPKDNLIVKAALKNKNLAGKIIEGKVGVLIGRDAHEYIKEQYPEIEISNNGSSTSSESSEYYQLNWIATQEDCQISQGKELKKEEVIAAQAGRFDYMRHNLAGLPFGIVECLNKRIIQEDRVVTGTISNFARLDGNQQNKAILDTFESLQATCGKPYTEGTCVLSLFFTQETMVIANLGDCYVFSVKIKENVVTTEHLNNDLIHNIPKNRETIQTQKLKERLKLSPNMPLIEMFANGMLKDVSNRSPVYFIPRSDEDGFLSVIGALGDTGYEESGLTHVPELKSLPREQLCEGERKFIVLGCDGVVETGQGKNDDHNWLGEIVAEYSDKTEGQISLAIVNAAIKRGSSDNISVVVIDLSSRSWNVNPNDATCFVMLDGHSRRDVQISVGPSEDVREVFLPTLNDCVKEQLQPAECASQTEKKRCREQVKKQDEHEECKENKLDEEGVHTEKRRRIGPAQKGQQEEQLLSECVDRPKTEKEKKKRHYEQVEQKDTGEESEENKENKSGEKEKHERKRKRLKRTGSGTMWESASSLNSNKENSGAASMEVEREEEGKEQGFNPTFNSGS